MADMPGSGDGLFDLLATLLDDEVPCALVTVVEGRGAGAKLLVRRTSGDGMEVHGTLGNADLDRVVARDALGELSLGRSGVRHYGE
ncbi:MAG: hypothetical protein CL442_07350, partial [Acidimicrobiaceae bacterium]|nr:hypothetical protein [Acidimicrobiaceae bacterium]